MKRAFTIADPDGASQKPGYRTDSKCVRIRRGRASTAIAFVLTALALITGLAGCGGGGGSTPNPTPPTNNRVCRGPGGLIVSCSSL